MAAKVKNPIKISKAQAEAMHRPVTAAERRAINAAAKRQVILQEPVDEEVELQDGDEAVEQAVPERVTRRASRQPTRQATREGMTRRTGRVEVRGRNGELLTRKRQGGIDPYFVDPAIIPPGWDYQWNAITILGNGDILQDQNLQMQENGWRAVPAERHSGRYMPHGYKGAIIRGGLRLEERPMALTKEARAEDLAAAQKLISDRNESLQLTSMKSRMPAGFEMSNKYRGAGGNIKMDIDPALDAPRPQHKVAE